MSPPKIGLIARSEVARGLGIQSRGFHDNVPVDRVLLVQMPQPDSDTADWWYPNATTITPDLRQHTLDEQQVRGWMAGLDVVFSVETPYDWRLPIWAREMGIKTVIQGNPEFTRHRLPEYLHLGNPDAWWWPTSWRLDLLPPGTLMPVPMPDSPMVGAEPGTKLRIYHTTGKRAFQDRNGTDVFFDALRAVYEPVHTTIYGLYKNLPQTPRLHPKQEVEVFEDGVEDQWEMHRNQHLLVMPRRYGGLSLPALEAASRGIAVLMPDVSPNAELAQILCPTRTYRFINVAAGALMVADTDHMVLGEMIDSLSKNPEAVAAAQQRAWNMVPRWSEWRARYIAEFEKVCNED